MISPQIKFKKKWSDNKGVSEIIGTILMLAITVVLFSSIMVFVTNMPTPIMRPTADFLSSLDVSTDPPTLTLTHNGGEALNDYETVILVIIDGTVRTRYFDTGTSTSKWSIGEPWKFTGFHNFGSNTSLEAMIIDTHSNSQIWDGKISAGAGNNAPVILQRWTDSDRTTLTPDPIIEGDVGFSFYVRVTDLDSTLVLGSVTVDATSISGTFTSAVSAGVWEFIFTNSITQASLFDGKPLFITASDGTHQAKETFILTVSASERGPQGEKGDPGDPGDEVTPGDEGIPSYIYYRSGDQGYVVVGEDKTAPRTWGATANTDDFRFNYTQGEGWIFFRVASKNVKNLDVMNAISIRNLYSNEEITPPSSSSAFALFTVSGLFYVYQYKFNSSALSAGAYATHIHLESSTSEGTSPGRCLADFILTIDAAAGQETVFSPTLYTFDKNRHLYSAQEWGTKTQPYDLSNLSTSIMWTEVEMQDVGAASSASIYEVRVLDLKGRTNLYGDPPTGDNMISSLSTDNTNITYYFSVDLRLKNGVTFNPGTAAYTLVLTRVFDGNEGIYTVSKPIWIKAAVETKNYIAGTSGFGWGKAVGGDNFIHSDYLFSIDNNKFFTTRVIDAADEDPGGGTSINVLKTLYFDMDEDGDRDVLSYYTRSGNNYLGVYINRMSEIGMWEPRSTFTNYTDTGSTVLSMAYGDVDADGDNDWVVSASSGNVYLFVNDFPVRTFTIFNTGALKYYNEMKLADVTGDGRADLIAMGYTASVVRGNIDSKMYIWNLTRGTTLTTGSGTNTPVSIVNVPTVGYVVDFDTGDIDNDGDLDYALISNFNDASHGIRWYQRTETLTSPGARTIGETAVTGVVAGVHTDTATDDGVYESITEVAGDLEHKWTLGSITGTKAIVYIDAKVSAAADEGFYLYYGRGINGPWSFMFIVPSSQTTDHTYSFPLPATVTGAGTYIRVIDASTTGSSNDVIYIDRIEVLSMTSVSFNTNYQVGTSNITVIAFDAIGIGDVDGLYYKDIVIGQTASTQSIYIFKDSAAHTYAAANCYKINYVDLSVNGNRFEVTDVNGDGLADIVTVAEESSSSYIAVVVEFLNLGSGTTWTNIIVKDIYANYGNKGGREVNCISVENMYG